jgi:hypothetical protein
MEIYRVAEMPVLLAIPLFTFAGYLLGESRAPRRLVRLSNALLGWMPGGLAVVALVVCALFTAFTGASGVTIVAMGALLYPALARPATARSFNLGLITTSGSLGLLFAPSLPSSCTASSPSSRVDHLFIAGILPGMLMVLLLAAGAPRGPVRAPPAPPGRLSPGARPRPAVREAIWELPLPVIVLGGVYSGFFAVSEAAAGHRRLRAGGGGAHLPRDPVRRLPGHHARVDGAGGRHPDHPRRVAGLHQLMIDARCRCGCSSSSRPRLVQAHLPDPAQPLPAGARHDARHLLGAGDRGAADPAASPPATASTPSTSA